MTLYIFENIHQQIKKGGRPPTVGHRITAQQFYVIERAIDRHINDTESKHQKAAWTEYKEAWRLKIKPEIV